MLKKQSKIFLVVFSFLIVITLSSKIESQSSLKVTIRKIEVNDRKSVNVIASINDSFDNPIQGIDNKSIEVYIDNIPTNVVSVHKAKLNYGLWVVLAIDVSGSMKGKPLSDAKRAAIIFLQSLEAKDRAALYSFESEVKEITSFSSNKQDLTQLVNELQTGRETALNEAIYDGIQKVTPIPAFRKAIIILTDGEDNNSAVTLEDCIQAVQKIPVPIYSIGFGSKLNPKKFRKTLGRISKISGGRSYYAPNSNALIKLYKAIAEQLENEYIITVDRSNSKKSIGLHQLILNVNLAFARASAFKNFEDTGQSSFISNSLVLPIILMVFFSFFFIAAIIFIAYKIYLSINS